MSDFLYDYNDDYDYFDPADFTFTSFDENVELDEFNHYMNNLFENAQTFSKASDLIESFNLLGFHDVCNNLKPADVTWDYKLPPWFESRNAKGTFFEN